MLVVPEPFQPVAEEVRDRLAPLEIDTDLVTAGDDLVSMLDAVKQSIEEAREHSRELLVNVGSGSKAAVLGGVLGAYLSGARVFDVRDGEPDLLPLLEFEATETISDPKIRVLREIEGMGGHTPKLDDLADACGIDKSLLSYHIRGSGDTPGLEDQGLVEVDRGVRGRLEIRLTDRGRVLLMLTDGD